MKSKVSPHRVSPISVSPKPPDTTTTCAATSPSPLAADSRIEKSNPNLKSIIGQESFRAQQLLESLTTSAESVLFPGEDACAEEKIEEITQRYSCEKEAAVTLYRSFLQKLEREECADLVKSVRLFVTGLKLQRESRMVSPKGSPAVPRDSRIVSFLKRMRAAVNAHPEWIKGDEDEVARARQCIDKYIMVRVNTFCFAVDPAELQEDARISRRFQVLATFVTATHLDVPQCCRNEMVLSLAQEELKRLNLYAAPADKVKCIFRSCAVLSNVLSLSLDSGGMDSFFPTFLHMLLHSGVSKLWCNVEYIRKFTDHSDLVSREGYCYTHLRSAIYFFDNLKPEQIGLTQEEVDRHTTEAEQRISAS